MGMNLTQIVGIVAGLFTASSLIPQVVKTLKEKKAEDVSMLTLIVLLTGVSLWIVYGIMRDDIPIIATNAISFMVNVTMIVLRVKYNR
jgi:MtN3 and saliva related transmembrane protein